MAAGPVQWTEARVQERYAEGRGQGTGESYSPWVRVQEFPSRGNQTRIPSVRIRRSIHTFSYLERDMYHLHEYLGFEDYREQAPLDRRITLGAAKVLGIRHPVYPRSDVPFVMMVDALVTQRVDGKRVVEAWDAKPKEKLANPRIRQKLTLHAAFFTYHGVRHRVFTEDSYPKVAIRNIEWARGGLPLEDELEVVPELFTRVADDFLGWLRSRRHRRPVWELCFLWDNKQRLEYGTSLRLFQFLIWHRRIAMNLTTPDITNSHLPVQVQPGSIDHESILHQRLA